MYVIVVRQLAQHYGKSPDLITHEELRQYFLYLKNLHQEWPALALVRPPRERKLPVVLSHQEVHRILGCLRRPYCRLRPEKLHVSLAEGSIADGPVTPRSYTLTHSDTTGDLFLTIGPAP
jgi:integrase